MCNVVQREPCKSCKGICLQLLLFLYEYVLLFLYVRTLVSVTYCRSTCSCNKPLLTYAIRYVRVRSTVCLFLHAYLCTYVPKQTVLKQVLQYISSRYLRTVLPYIRFDSILQYVLPPRAPYVASLPRVRHRTSVEDTYIRTVYLVPRTSYGSTFTKVFFRRTVTAVSCMKDV